MSNPDKLEKYELDDLKPLNKIEIFLFYLGCCAFGFLLVTIPYLLFW